MKVSVIVPVYNAAPHLPRCVESLLRQTLPECEFIFVNDGSTDQSGRLLESYKRSDRRIRVVHQDNQGVSNARNAGMQLAQGEYVGFVDADDDVENDMFETLYAEAKAEDCDAVISNFESELDGHRVVTSYPFPKGIVLDREYIRTEILPFFLQSNAMNTAVNKLYKSKGIHEYGAAFPPRVALGEDGLFNMRFFAQARSAKYIDYTGYHYRETTGSATRNIRAKDYFHRALEDYRMELPSQLIGALDEGKAMIYKATKLIHNVMSYIHIYFAPSKDMELAERWRYVRGMVEHEDVGRALSLCWPIRYSEMGAYEKLIMNLMKRKLVFGLFCAAAYSRLRNHR